MKNTPIYSKNKFCWHTIELIFGYSIFSLEVFKLQKQNFIMY